MNTYGIHNIEWDLQPQFDTQQFYPGQVFCEWRLSEQQRNTALDQAQAYQRMLELTA